MLSVLLLFCFLALIVIPIDLFEYLKVSNYDILFIAISVVCISILYPLLKWLFEKIFNYTVKKTKEHKERKIVKS